MLSQLCVGFDWSHFPEEPYLHVYYNLRKFGRDGSVIEANLIEEQCNFSAVSAE